MPLLETTRLRLLESALHAVDRVAIRLRRLPARAPHLATGVRGEEAAFFHLRRNGYIVVARGWRWSRQRGDLDLVAWDGDTLCFVEVKTRTSHEVATAESSVDHDKRQVIRRLARAYLRQFPQDAQPPVRFDILTIHYEKKNAAEFQHFRGAFGWF